MCTAITFQSHDHYFGRNLDYERSFGEQVTVTPRNFPFFFRDHAPLERHYAVIGMAHVRENYPLYYDAVNERGLAVAGLLFQENAVYQSPHPQRDNIASFELIPWLLGQCATLSDVKRLLSRIQITHAHFSRELPPSPLHWLIADREGAIVVEAVREGLRIYDDPLGVLTNNPPFPFQTTHLTQFLNLTAQPPVNRFAPHVALTPYSRGMGALGLPGDFSSPSRFVKAAFVKHNSRCGSSEEESVSQFFHLLHSVEQVRGSVRLEDDLCEITLYTSCCNCDRGIYYYTTYENSRITAVDMGLEDLDDRELISYPLATAPSVLLQNKKD